MENKDIIELAREIGRQLQKNDSYIKYQLAKQQADENEELQDLINEFNLKKIEVGNEASKQERDPERLRQLNTEMRAAYAKIITNDSYVKYNESKEELNMLLTRVNAIIQQSSEGEDPETADYIPSDCTGSCSSCSGCH